MAYICINTLITIFGKIHVHSHIHEQIRLTMTLVYSFTCLGLTKCSTFGAVVDFFRGRSSFLYVTFKWKTRRMNTPKKYSKYMLKVNSERS